MEGTVYILGIGPGSRDYLLPVTEKLAGEMDVLIGGKRALALFRNLGKKEIAITSDLEHIKEYILANHMREKIAVLVSGDPGLYSMLKYISGFLDRSKLRVEPGISALQLAFARAGLSWQQAEIASLHGRTNLDQLLDVVRGGGRVGLFVGPEYPPQRIARFLVEKGYGQRRASVCERLSYEDERMIEKTLGELAGGDFEDLAVMIIHER